MPRRPPRALAAGLALLLAVLVRAEEGDWGYAQNFHVVKAINEQWSLLHRSNFTLRDDMGDLFLAYADLGIGYRLHPAWRIDAAYRRSWFRPGGTWLLEDIPYFNLNWFGNLGDARLSNRSRIEFREYRYDKDDDIRLRNETRLDLPWHVLPGGIRPYFEEEFFWGRNSSRLEMNWLTGGLYLKPTPWSKLKLGYRWVAIWTGTGWENRNQLVSGLNLFF